MPIRPPSSGTAARSAPGLYLPRPRSASGKDHTTSISCQDLRERPLPGSTPTPGVGPDDRVEQLFIPVGTPERPGPHSRGIP